MNLKCAVFDFDGTLFDSMYVWDKAGALYLESLGKTPKPSLREALRVLSLAQTAVFLRREYGLTLSDREIMAGINRTVEGFYLHDVVPKPGAKAFLDRLRTAGIPLAVATATDRYQILAALARCGMEHCFSALFTCGEVGCGKDRPDIFRRAAAYFGADRDSTVVFEDSLYAARTAAKDGFIVAAVYDPSEKRQTELRRLADVYLRDFEHTEPFWRFLTAGKDSGPGG